MANPDTVSERQKELAALRRENEELQALLTRCRGELESVLASEMKYRSLLDDSSDPMFVINADGRYFHVNKAFADGVRRPVGEIVGRRIWDVFPEKEAEQRFSAVREVLQTGKTKVIDVKVIAGDEAHFYITTVKPLRKEEGGPADSVICISKDITQRKKAEDELRLSEARYRLLYNQSPVMLHSIDRDGRIVSVSDTWLAKMGYTREEVIGRPSVDFLTEASRRYATSEVLPEFREKGFCADVPYQFVKKNGEIVDILLSAIAERDAEGRYLRSLAVLIDVTQTKLSEKALREKTEELNQFFSLTLDLLGIADSDGWFHAINPAWEEVLGYSRQELLARSFLDFIHPDDLEATRGLLAELAGKKRAYDFVNRCRHQDGSYRWIEWRSVFDPTTRRIYVAARDITERMKAEQAHLQLGSLIENSLEFVGIATLDGKTLFLNPAARRMVGLSPEAAITDLSIFNFAPEDAQIQMAQEVIPALLEAGSWHGDGQLRNFQTGEIIQTDISVFIPGFPKIDSQSIIATVMHDITERKRSEAALRASEERYRQIVETSNEGIWSLNANLETVYVNQKMAAMLGYPASEIIGKSPTCFLFAEDVEAHLEKLRERTKGVDQLYEQRYRRQDGSELWVTISASSLVDETGKFLGSFAMFTDITDRMRLQGQLMHAQKMESIGRLAGGVAHDFNNLLTGIMGNLELAMMDLNPSDPLYETLGDVNKAAESAANLTRQLLAFSRKQIVEPKVLNLNDVLTRMKKMLIRLIGEDIVLHTVLAADLWPVKIDPGQVEQIIVNLAVNARDAMPAGGKLLLETATIVLDEEYCRLHPEAQAGDYVMLAISDNGCGMSEQVKRHLFEPFFTTKEKGKGTGLGLATIYGAVKQAGGSIEVYSELNQGTTVKVYLPRVIGTTETVSETIPLTNLPTGQEQLLLVEDEAIVRDLAVRVLSRLGYRLLHCANAEQALNAAKEFPDKISLLITDVIMPGMNGKMLAMELLKTRPEIRVLFTSGYTENVIVHHGVLDEGIHFIGKPYTPQTLARKVREVLDREK
ncbi:MAG: PAS domain S-box protein [Myxococcales bacterium]|nr:PAS domain S-box protein [Myxococcales bacterium]